MFDKRKYKINCTYFLTLYSSSSGVSTFPSSSNLENRRRQGLAQLVHSFLIPSSANTNQHISHIYSFTAVNISIVSPPECFVDKACFWSNLNLFI